ncbi:acyl-CoA dehydrogenase family protein [Dactylosporangium sp. NPDC049140]|uniref:acyl-CoA dehydrogenase family protein n=1 Tax=Dactylosporangium sp. NPDC049140 TaxID=3155647 RepID=UPI0033C6BECA
MTPDELAALSDSVRGVAARHWGSATAAGTGKLGDLYSAGEAQGWFGIGADDDLGAALTVTRALGALACPLPVMDAFVAARLGLTGRRVLAGTALEHLDAAGDATHVLHLGEAALYEIAEREEQPGLAVPTWSRVRPGPLVLSVRMTDRQRDESIALLRLGLAARALAAAQRAHEMAVEHAKTRRQFGAPIGSFGAVQQRAATCQIDVSAGNHLIDRAAGAYAAGRDDWPLQAEIAVEFVAAAARRVQLGAHHTLAAIGYFEEHEAPWLFRRVHADVARLADLRPAAGSVADVLVETGSPLPAFDAGEVGERFRREVRDVIAACDDATIADEMAGRGWFGMGWPETAGGRNASLAEQVVLHEEITYARAPVVLQLGSVMLLGGSILRHGSAEQQETFLPLIRAGKLRFCLGYSEPEAGSDLASLKTRADRDGDGWVVNGQKLWTTGGHRASHVWLATRTDPDASPPHAGITVFLVPMDTPGITVQQHRALSGEISCTVFYDDVRIPDSYRVGEVNGGWKVITDALAGERVLMGGIAASLLRQLDDLLAVVRTDPDAWVGPRGSARRARLGELAVTLQANRALVAAAIGATAGGRGARLEAPMAGVLGGELAEQFGEAMLDILGPQAALSGDVPGGGAFEYGLRLSIMYVVGGGTNDIQRGLIARGLGLPR